MEILYPHYFSTEPDNWQLISLVFILIYSTGLKKMIENLDMNEKLLTFATTYDK